MSRTEKRSPSGTGPGDWLVNVAGDVVVPMSTADIVEGLRSGKLSERSLVWRLGMQDWIVLGEVPQLRLAAGAASVSAPPASARVSHAPREQQAEPARRNTLPYGFPVARDPASVRQPVGLNLTSPLSTPVSAPRGAAPLESNDDDDDALAVYERPAASLTFSESVRAEWNGESRLVTQSAPPPSAPPASTRRLTPVPAATARFSQPPRSVLPNSLIPTTSELDSRGSSRPPNHADLSVVLASDFRAAKASTKRVALWAALGSALAASALTLWLVRKPAPESPTTSLAAQPVAAQAIAAPPAAPAPVELPTPSAPASALALPIKAVIPRVPKAALRPRVKHAPQVEPAAAVAVSQPEPSDNPYDLGPTTPSEPRAAATQEATPTNNAASESKPTPAAAPEAAPASAPPAAP